MSTPPFSALILSTDVELQDSLRQLFGAEAYRVLASESLSYALYALDQGLVNLTILDTRCRGPLLDPWEACAQIPGRGRALLMAIVENSEDVQRALRLEADDALIPPLYLREVAARARALLRRTAGPTSKGRTDLYLDRDLLIDFATHEVWVRGGRIRFTPREYSLLAALARRPGQIVTCPQLTWLAWDEPANQARAPLLKQYIWRLRQRIERNPDSPEIIITHRREGYEFRRVWQDQGGLMRSASVQT